MTRQREPEHELPLTPAMFHVLLALAEDDRHGYAILKAVRDRTNGAVDLSTGTLYTMIKRLLADGLVVESRHRPPGDDPRRRYYRVTDWGRRVLAAESERLRDMVSAARSAGVFRRQPG